MYAFGPYRLHPDQHRLFKNGEVVPLTGKTFALLVALVEAAGQLKSRGELIERLWPDTIVEEHNLTWNVSALRKVLGDEGQLPLYVETVRGQGYRFVAPVSAKQEQAARPSHVLLDKRLWIATGATLVLLVLVAAGTFLRSPRKPKTVMNSTSLGPPVRSIAVLPFENLSTDKADAYFASGIQSVVVTKLASLSDFKVISRTSTETYVSHPADIKVVAQQLGVATVLEGSVQKASNEVLISLQLVDGRTGEHIWAQAYQRKLGNVFGVEGDVAQQVAIALKARLRPAEEARMMRPPTENARAYDSFLKAEFLATLVEKRAAKDPAAEIVKATALYQEAVSLDPRFALAYARLSYLESYAYWFALDHTPARIANAGAAARKALALEPDLTLAHLSMGFVYYRRNRDYEKALTEFELAEGDVPNDARAVAAIAYINRRQGNWREAVNGLQQASELDPRNPLWPEELGNTYAALGDYQYADSSYDRALAIDPNDYSAVVFKSLTRFLAGDSTGAQRALTDLPSSPDRRGLIAAAHFDAAWFAHDPDGALGSIAGAPEWVSAVGIPGLIPTNGFIPTSFLRGEAIALKGDNVRARQEYENSRKALQVALKNHADNPDLWVLLGLTEAALGNKLDAIEAGKRAQELVPVSGDALDGPSYLIEEAEIYARVGDSDSALNLFQKVFSVPSGLAISRPLLGVDPRWNTIRADRRFQILLRGARAAVQSSATPSFN